MTPEEREQFEELKKKVRDLELVLGIDFIENLRERIEERIDEMVFGGLGTVDTTGISGTENGSNAILRDVVITFPSVGGTPPDTASQTITVLDAPSTFLTTDYKGTTYNIGIWE